MKKPRLFNEFGKDTHEAQSIFGGDPTGISNLNQQRYAWVNPLYRNMLANFWLPQKVNLTEDRTTINQLTEDEDKAVRDTLSFLIFLDSFQTNNLPNIGEYITNPGVKNLLHIQTFQEVIHSETYQYILEALYPSMEREAIYNRWRDNRILKERNNTISRIAQEFVDNPSEDSMSSVLIANYVLEGVYFYQGFNLFDQLAHRKKLVQTAKEIEYIRRDELTHVGIFINILRDMDKKKIENKVYSIFQDAVDQEICWCKSIYGNRILGITERSSETYIKYLANDRLKKIGFDAIFGEVENPYKHLDNSKRENFFESGAVTSYDTAASVDGWDDL